MAHGVDTEPINGDLLYEEDILRNAYSLKYWIRYIEAKAKARRASGTSSLSAAGHCRADKIWPLPERPAAQVRNRPPTTRR